MIENRTIKTLRVLLAVVFLVAGILTVIFSILALAGTSSIDETTALRFVIGVSLCVFGCVNLANGLIKIENKRIVLAVSAITLGMGIFLFFNDAATILDILISLAVPINVACFGGVYLFKGIFDAYKKTNRNYIFEIIFGAITLIAGIVFAVFHKNLYHVVCLLIGITIILLSIVQTIYSVRRKRMASKATASSTENKE